MPLFRKYFGRKIAIKLFWLVILFLLSFAIFDRYKPFSDSSTAIVLGSCFAGCSLLGIYICNARKKYSKGNLEFTFSQECNNSVEMHFKRKSCAEIKNLRTTLMGALIEMHSYAKSIGAKRIIIESPLLDEKFSSRAAKYIAKRLSVNYQLHQPKAMNPVVSILANREMSKCCKPKSSLCNSLSAKLVSHGFSLDL